MSHPRYRRHSDGRVGEAFQYVEEGKPWRNEIVTEVAQFVIGVDVDNHTTVANERLLDVVRPILVDWSPLEGKAPINVAVSENVVRVEVGDWIVRFSGNEPLAFVAKERFGVYYESVELIDGVYKSQKDLDIEEITDLVYNKCFLPLHKGPTFQELANTTAKTIVRDGWRKVKK